MREKGKECYGKLVKKQFKNILKINLIIGKKQNDADLTNTIEGFWGTLKRMIEGIYHSISSKYIQRYIYEAVYRYNTRKTSGSDCFKQMFVNSIGVVDYEMVKNLA